MATVPENQKLMMMAVCVCVCAFWATARPQITLAVEMLSRRLGRLDTYLLAMSVITAGSVVALVAFGKRKHLLWSC